MVDDWVALSPTNALIIPHTVPNRPMNGVALAVGSEKGQRPFQLGESRAAARRMARSTLATPASSVLSGASSARVWRFARDKRTSS